VSLRKERMTDEIRDLLAITFQGDSIQDPRLTGVTITAVKLTPDLQLAYVYFRLFDPSKTPDALKGFQSCAGFLRTKLADSLEVRRVPELKFFYDETIEKGEKIEKILSHIKKENPS
jgi:ribosome-binding factor A